MTTELKEPGRDLGERPRLLRRMTTGDRAKGAVMCQTDPPEDETQRSLDDPVSTDTGEWPAPGTQIPAEAPDVERQPVEEAAGQSTSQVAAWQDPFPLPEATAPAVDSTGMILDAISRL